MTLCCTCSYCSKLGVDLSDATFNAMQHVIEQVIDVYLDAY